MDQQHELYCIERSYYSSMILETTKNIGQIVWG